MLKGAVIMIYRGERMNAYEVNTNSIKKLVNLKILALVAATFGFSTTGYSACPATANTPSCANINNPSTPKPAGVSDAQWDWAKVLCATPDNKLKDFLGMTNSVNPLVKGEPIFPGCVLVQSAGCGGYCSCEFYLRSSHANAKDPSPINHPGLPKVPGLPGEKMTDPAKLRWSTGCINGSGSSTVSNWYGMNSITNTCTPTEAGQPVHGDGLRNILFRTLLDPDNLCAIASDNGPPGYSSGPNPSGSGSVRNYARPQAAGALPPYKLAATGSQVYELKVAASKISGSNAVLPVYCQAEGVNSNVRSKTNSVIDKLVEKSGSETPRLSSDELVRSNAVCPLLAADLNAALAKARSNAVIDELRGYPASFNVLPTKVGKNATDDVVGYVLKNGPSDQLATSFSSEQSNIGNVYYFQLPTAGAFPTKALPATNPPAPGVLIMAPERAYIDEAGHTQ